MDFVPIELSGRTYRLRYTADDIQDICRRMTPLQPPGAGKVTPPVLGSLLVNLDPDAFQFCFWAGMRHIAEYRNIDAVAAQKILTKAISDGLQYTDLRRPIFKGLIQCGLAEFAPILRILEDEDAKRVQLDAEAMTEGGAGVTEEQEDRDPGKPSTTPSPSTIRTLTPRSPMDASDFSTSTPG